MVFRSARKVRAEACRDFLRACLGLPAFEDFEQTDNGGRLLRLDLAITDMSAGTTALRLLKWPLMLFGLGHAHLQVEGMLSEPRRRQVLLKFVARRWHSSRAAREDEMPAPDDPALPRDFPRTMVGHLIRRTAYDIIMELDARLNRKK